MPPALAIICWIGYALALVFLFCPLHECIHGTAFSTRYLNRTVALVCGLVLFLPPQYFRVFHLTHHRHTQIPDLDPELGMPKPRTRLEYVWVVSGIPYWMAQVRMFRDYAFDQVDDFVPAARRNELVREIRWFLLLYLGLAIGSVLLGMTVLFWFWILPILVAQPALRMFLMAEHTGCPETPDMFDNTRTTYTHPLLQRLCWNMNFHTAHHAYAGIPFHRLPEANQMIADRLIYVGQGYFRVNHDFYRSLNRMSDGP